MDKILSFLKKYTSLLIPAGIVLVVVLVLIPTVLIGRSVEEKMDESIRIGRNVDNLRSRAHSEEDVKMMKSFQDAYEADAEAVENLAKQTTQRELVSYDIFPEPKDESVQIYEEFGANFRTEVEALLRRINARNAPTDNEIETEMAARGTTGDYNRSGRGRRSRSRTSRRRQDDGAEKVRDLILKKRAQEMSIYATANIFDWYRFWEKYKFESRDTAVENCWYSQLAFWVYEDVVETIKAINAASRAGVADDMGVLTSDVKRLVGVNFQKHADYYDDSARSGYGGYSMSENAFADNPDYVLDVEKESVFGIRPWTGRVCDDTVDVIHFSMAVVINSQAVFPFIKELCSVKKHTFKGYDGKSPEQTFERNQITVLQYWQEPVDMLSANHDRYRYGNSGVVKLSLTCEYIFNRGGYQEIKPRTIEEYLVETKELIEKAANPTNMFGPPPG